MHVLISKFEHGLLRLGIDAVSFFSRTKSSGRGIHVLMSKVYRIYEASTLRLIANCKTYGQSRKATQKIHIHCAIPKKLEF